MGWPEDQAFLAEHFSKIITTATTARAKLTRWDKASSKVGFDAVIAEAKAGQARLAAIVPPAPAPAPAPAPTPTPAPIPKPPAPGTVYPTAPAGAIRINAGTSVQEQINAQSDGTAFILVGRHERQVIWPKRGTAIYSEGGVLDGMGMAGSCVYPTADDVTLSGITVQGYKPGAQVGAVAAGTHEDVRFRWRLDNVLVTLNDGLGIRIGSQMLVTRCKTIRNGQMGIGGVGDDTVIEDHETAWNNPDMAYDPGWEAGGSKFVLTNRLKVRRSFAHHNNGPGWWNDIENRDVLYEDDLSEDNMELGYFHEISYSAIFRRCISRRNGFGMMRWAYGAGFLIAHSSDVQVHDSTSEDDWNGISCIQQPRGNDGAGAPYQLRNVEVRNNTIIRTKPMQPDSSGNGANLAGVSMEGDLAGYDRNIRYNANTYRVADKAARLWTFHNQRMTWAEWRAAGQDTTGTLV